ncbi:hypothetical protein BDW67DRAFT_186264 [Aspergillus spinulosporus]
MTNPPPKADFTVAWICLRLDLVAAREMFDHACGTHPQTLHPSDTNFYELGKIDRNYIIIVYLYSVAATDTPIGGRYGTAETASKQMNATFVSLKVRLFIALGSRIPCGLNDMRLGDVAVSTSEQEIWGVVGLALESPSEPPSSASDPKRTSLLLPREGYSHLTTAAHALAADRTLGVPSKITNSLSKVFEWYPEKTTVYAYPGVADDVFVQTEYKRRFHRKKQAKLFLSLLE